MERLKEDELDPKKLPVSFRGFDRRAVAELLKKVEETLQVVASDVDQARLEAAEQRSRAERAEADLEVLRSDEGSLKEALLTAQKASEEIRANALRQADHILEEARQQAARTESELQERLNDIRWELEKLSIDRQRFLNSFRSLLEEYLAGLVEGHAHAAKGFPAGDGAEAAPEAVVAALEPAPEPEEPVSDREPSVGAEDDAPPQEASEAASEGG